MKRALAIFIFIFAFVFYFFTPILSAQTTVSGNIGNISEDTVWTSSDSPYIVSGSVTINTGVTLTIEEGVIIKFSTDSDFIVNGNLVINGTDTNKVYFTSIKDDSVAGDTNGDGTLTLPSPGDWLRITFQNGSTGVLNSLVLKYADGILLFVDFGAIRNNGGDITISDSIISDSRLQGIFQNSGSVTLNNTEISNSQFGIETFGGSIAIQDSFFHDLTDYAVLDRSGSLDVTNTRFENNGIPLALDVNVDFTHSGNLFENNVQNGFEVGGTLISKDIIWKADSVPYIVSFVDLFSDSSLIIEPGVVVKFKFEGLILVNDGNFVANGTPEKPIYFTSIKDDSVGGDTNGDGGASLPSANDFYGVQFRGGGTGNLDNFVFRYGGGFQPGRFVSDFGAINNVGGSVLLKNGELTFNGYAAVRNQNGGSMQVFSSSISRNPLLGVSNETGILMDAENNWWGDSSGPFNLALNPGGLGDKVQNDVDFIPWLTTDPFATSTTPTTPARTPVLIVPGVLGTDILKGSEKLWMDIVRNITDIGDQFMDPLQFDSSLLPLDTSLSLGNVISKEGSPVFTFDYTEGLINELKNQGYTEGVSSNDNLFLFPYDWRYGVSGTNVDQIKQRILDIRSQTGSDKVDIIAHSTGGLLVKKYMVDNPADHHVNKAVFVGVPNTGAPKAIKVLLQGDGFGNPFLSDGEMKKIAGNLPVIYDLSPSEQYYNQKGSYVEIVNQGLLSSTSQDLDFDQVKDFLTNDHQLNLQAIINAESLHTDLFDNYDLQTTGVDLYNISGCKTGTIGKVVEKRVQTIFGGTKISYELKNTPGDGTVPLESATNLPVNPNNKFYALKSEHGKMLSQDNIRQQIVNIISGSNLDTGGKITQDISLCKLNGKAISVFSPVNLEIVDQDGNYSGTDEDGNIFNEIPNANFSVMGEEKFAYLPTDEGQIYTISLSGAGNGTFTLQSSDIVDDQIIQTETFSDIPVTVNLKGNFDVESLTLALDINGDGVVDEVVSSDREQPSLTELLTFFKEKTQLLNVNSNLKKNILKRVESLEKKIEKEKVRKVKIIKKLKNRFIKQELKGVIDISDANSVLELLEFLEVQVEDVVLGTDILSALKLKIQSLNITQTQKNTFIKRVERLESQQSLVKTLSNLAENITRKGKNGKIEDAEARELISLIEQIENLI